MKTFEKLEALAKLKEETIRANTNIEQENEKLQKEKDVLVEQRINEFVEELSALAKYSEPLYANLDIKLTFYSDIDSFNDVPKLFYRVYETNNSKEFQLETNLPNDYKYSCRQIVYSSEAGWVWRPKQCQDFIALNKDAIIDAIEDVIARKMVSYIESTSLTELNVQLKKDIKDLSK